MSRNGCLNFRHFLGKTFAKWKYSITYRRTLIAISIILVTESHSHNHNSARSSLPFCNITQGVLLVRINEGSGFISECSLSQENSFMLQILSEIIRLRILYERNSISL